MIFSSKPHICDGVRRGIGNIQPLVIFKTIRYDLKGRVSFQRRNRKKFVDRIPRKRDSIITYILVDSVRYLVPSDGTVLVFSNDCHFHFLFFILGDKKKNSHKDGLYVILEVSTKTPLYIHNKILSRGNTT